ncbi:hypothetical protein BST81_18315 [Leptolyngbya sp. 'hensonii']|nr:hypothetical protein BST81_18315 [Leptolyngbya sp. 'hensonii']
MKIIICPGVHSPTLTESFLEALEMELTASGSSLDLADHLLVYPAHQMPAYSGCHLFQFLHRQLAPQVLVDPLLFIGFSAGVVGAIVAAQMWQSQGGTIAALIALDGWGVPLAGQFPIHRVSHDGFTHWSSLCLGGQGDSFYAEPGTEHLTLWRSPHTVTGYRLPAEPSWLTPSLTRPTTAVRFLTTLLQCYGKSRPFSEAIP